MTPEDFRKKYNDIEPVVGEVTEVRVSPNRRRVARRIPDELVHEDRRWVSFYFIDEIGLTVSLLSDEDVADWLALEVKG